MSIDTNLTDFIGMLANVPASDVVQTTVAVLTAIVGVITAFSSFFVSASRKSYSQPDKPNETQLDLQIEEIKSYLKQQVLQSGLHRFFYVVMNVLQYGIGGILLLSFAAKNISPDMSGIMGVSTLLCSFAQETIRPNIKAKMASRRVSELRAILRRAEIARTGAELSAIPEETLELATKFLGELHRVQSDNWIETQRISSS